MTVKKLDERLRNHTDKQFINYVKSHWCKGKRKVLIDMLDDMDLYHHQDYTMDELIHIYRNEITDYILEAYYNS